LAVQLWPLYETTAPDEYEEDELHAAAQEPPPLPVPVEVAEADADAEALAVVAVADEVAGGVAPANSASYLVKSQLFWVTLEHEPESVPLLLGGLHWRSRLTDQNEYRPRPTPSAQVSTDWKSVW
jgi:hypothetical protein